MSQVHSSHGGRLRVFARLFLSLESNAVQMNPASAPKKKRSSQQIANDPEDDETASNNPSAANTSPGANGSSSLSSSNFRNVSACNRCRLRKNRCDQKLPACTSCEKANVKYDRCLAERVDSPPTNVAPDVWVSTPSANARSQEGEDGSCSERG